MMYFCMLVTRALSFRSSSLVSQQTACIPEHDLDSSDGLQVHRSPRSATCCLCGSMQMVQGRVPRLSC